MSCGRLCDYAVLPQLNALAFNLIDFIRTPASPKEMEHWQLTTLREKLVKLGAKVLGHDRYITFQMAEAAKSRDLFQRDPVVDP